MDSPTRPTKPYRPKRSMLNWVDFLVIAATVLTFGAVVVANKPQAKPRPNPAVTTFALPEQPQHVPAELALIRAKIRLMNGGPWT
jgi:hypothetical protein